MNIKKTEEAKGEVIFHFGGPKTGSSAIQSWLARNREYLKANQISYPVSKGDDKAIANRISSGNATWHTNPQLSEIKGGQLWSSELLFHSSSFRDMLSMRERKSDLKFIVCGYYRDPLEWAISGWMQNIKRGGGQMGLDKFLTRHGIGKLRELLTWLEFSRDSGIELRLFNYENHKAFIVKHFLENCLDLSLPGGSQDSSMEARINRSLNLGETALLIEINKTQLGDSQLGRKVSDALVEGLPEMNSSSPKPSSQKLEWFNQEITPLVKKINSMLPQNEGLNHPAENPRPDVIDGEVSLPVKWFELLGQVIGSSNLKLGQHDRDALMRIASEIELGVNISSEDASKLRKIAGNQN